MRNHASSTGGLTAVVLAGGAGTRLWPLSRRQYPKQFLSPDGNGSLLRETLRRLDGFDAGLGFCVVAHEDYRFLVAEELRDAGKRADILIEPAARSTAPAIAFAAFAAHARDPDALLLVLPCDHVLRDRDAFHAAIRRALPAAHAGRLVLFGVEPDRGETAYGYVRCGKASLGVRTVTRFVEKPAAAAAQDYARSGEYYWNSGMFLFRADSYLAELQRHAPDIHDAMRAAFDGGQADADFLRPARDAFHACRSESVDYAVLERTDRAVLVPLDAGWVDVGTWNALAEAGTADAQGNVFHGDVFAMHTENTLVHSEGRLVATLGIRDQIIVETPDALLVASRRHAQEVRQVVAQLGLAGRREVAEHRRVHRPWGYYENVLQGDSFQVKKLCVKPGAALSLQMHHHRAEHWVVVSGTARVTNGDRTFLLAEDESTFIRKGSRHRLENPGRIMLEVVEVQSGSYLGEDDIVRYQDSYGRADLH